MTWQLAGTSSPVRSLGSASTPQRPSVTSIGTTVDLA
jgi:hypothetical protein